MRTLINNIVDEWAVLVLFGMWCIITIYIGRLLYILHKQNNHKHIRERWSHKSLH